MLKNNHDNVSGIFTVPKDGLYQFSFTMFFITGNLHARIMQNKQVIDQHDGHSTGVSAAINVAISCKLGDSVCVRHMTGIGAQNIHGQDKQHFLDFFILKLVV